MSRKYEIPFRFIAHEQETYGFEIDIKISDVPAEEQDGFIDSACEIIIDTFEEFLLFIKTNGFSNEVVSRPDFTKHNNRVFINLPARIFQKEWLLLILINVFDYSFGADYEADEDITKEDWEVISGFRIIYPQDKILSSSIDSLVKNFQDDMNGTLHHIQQECNLNIEFDAPFRDEDSYFDDTLGMFYRTDYKIGDLDGSKKIQIEEGFSSLVKITAMTGFENEINQLQWKLSGKILTSMNINFKNNTLHYGEDYAIINFSSLLFLSWIIWKENFGINISSINALLYEV